MRIYAVENLEYADNFEIEPLRKCTNNGDIKHKFVVCKQQASMFSSVSINPADSERARLRKHYEKISDDIRKAFGRKSKIPFLKSYLLG